MSLLSKELKDTKYLETIKKIQFSLLNPDEIREASVCEITIPETYDGTEPKINGLLDPRMGVLELRKKCPTDEHDSEICPGYFGHIELARPVFHIHFMSFILKVLRCVCYRCSNILIDKSDIYTMREIEKRTGRSRFAYVLQNCIKTKLCEFNDCCNAIQPSKYVKLTSDKIKDRDNIVKIVGEFNETAISSESKINKNQLFTPEMCYNIFKNISEEDVEILGFNNKYSRPEWMICKVLPVPPPYVRPSVRQDNNQRAEDDLTHALINIVKHNNILRNKIEANADKKTIDIYEGCLQLCIATYIDNELPRVKPLMHRSGKPLKTLKKRLKGKDGRIRGNLMGKRVDRSARSVISCDPNIMIDQLGVPIKIAMNITYPEKVTKWNKDQLYKYVRNGPNKYPGAKFINRMEIDCNGIAAPCEISLKYVDPNKIVLQEGDEVHRHLLDDDIVLFNRQPSLHRMSMMAHRVKVVKHNTFRLNNTVTKPYNADFDGDEMNMHQPPNWQTRVEIENLALVPTQIISPANCGPIISIVQDTLVGSYLFTATGAKIGKYELNNLMMFNQNFDGNLLEADDNGKWSGRRVYSMILPNISINEKDIVVDKGVMTNGILKKGTINNSLVKLIYSVYGPNVCKDFLDSTQSLITRWLITHSFSIGYGDCLIDKSIREESKKKLDEKLEVANDVLRKVHKGDFYENIVNNTLRQNIFESEMKAKLNEASESSYKIIQAKLKELSYKNSFVAVTSLGAGAKGDDTNLRKIMSNLGQYTIWGSRIPTNFTDRTLPHYPKFDESPQSKGFCKNSFIEGLTPTESFFTAMSGRSTSIDTAIKTSESGYISRKLIKALEDLKVNYDYSIRNANNVIVQFVYGDDNFDPTKLERQSFKLIEYDNNKMKEEFYIIYDNKTNWSLYFTDDIVKEIKNDKEMLEIFDIEYDKLMKYREVLRKDIYKNLDVIGAVQVYSPFNLSRIIHQAIKKFNSGYKCNISPKYIYYELDKLYENITKYFKKHNNGNLILVRMIIESQLSIKNVVVKYKLDKDTFDYIIKQVELKVISSFIQPGELVGVVSAQSLGEPTTQMTLNTFHSTGVSSKSVVTSTGVPRMRELLNHSKNIRTKSMTIYLKNELQFDKNKADLMKYQLQFTTIADIINTSEIIYEKNKPEYMNEEDVYMKSYEMFNEIIGLDNINMISPWTLKLTFDPDSLLNSNILMSELQEAIISNDAFEDHIKPFFTDDNSSNLVLKIKIGDFKDDEDSIQFLKEIEKHILCIKLRGITGIRKVGMEEMNIVRYYEDGSCENAKEWTLNTDGSNLLELMTYDDIDSERTTSNDINEILEIFGIEGARSKYIEEFQYIMQESGVNYRHIELLADIMTYKGTVMQIDRHGINKSADNGPIKKATFEETGDVLVNSAIFAEVDKMKGVSANVMFGQYPRAGTNAFDILIDDNMIINNQEIDEEDDIDYIGDEEIDLNQIDKQLEEDFKNKTGKLEKVNDNSFILDAGIHTVNIKPIKKKMNKVEVKII